MGAYPAATAIAGDTSPYLIGHWHLNDVFADFKSDGAKPLATQNTEFIFLNPTSLNKLILEYAFFATDDTPQRNVMFCGCDRDRLNANGRVRYTMRGEMEGGQFSKKLCPTQTDGAMKTIVFVKTDDKGKLVIGDALQGGYQIDVLGRPPAKPGQDGDPERTEAGLLAVNLNDSTRADMQAVHNACNAFIKQ
jgi:hypothetical protein